MHTPRRSSSMNQCVDKMTLSPTNDTNFEKHPGVSFLKGKWVAKIWHPMRKVWVCVGTYSSSKDAADAFDRKKLEYESPSVQEMVDSFHTDVTDFEKHPGVMRMESGTWRAVIKHKEVKVSLGTYNTLNEAVDAYNLSKIERDSKKKGCSKNQMPKPRTRSSYAKQMHPDFGNQPGVCSPKPGKWVAKICHPVRKVWVCVGIYSTPEEAADAYTTKKLEYESRSVQETTPFHSIVADFEKQPGVIRMTSGKWRAVIKHNKVKVSLGTYNTLDEAADSYNMSKLELDPQKPRHAYLTKSGRWHSEIRHPLIKGKKVHLGTFDTAEEAEEAYNNKRREFDLMFPSHEKHKESTNSCNADATPVGKSDSTCVFGNPSVFTGVQLGNVTEEAEGAYKNKMGEFDLMVSDQTKKSKQSNNKCEAATIVEGKSNSTFVSDDPSVSTRIHLGTYTVDPEEAYNNTTHQFDLMVREHIKVVKQPNSNYKAGSIVEGKSDSSCASDNPSVFTRVHVEYFTKEAEEAYNNEMREFDLMVHDHKKPKQSKASREADTIAEGTRDSNCISDDLSVSNRVHLGNSTQEARYNKMREFDVMVHPNKKHRQLEASCDSTCVSDYPAVFTRIHLGNFTEEAEEAYNNMMCEFDLAVRAHKKHKQLKGSSEADAIVEGKRDSSFISTIESLAIKAEREEETRGSMTNLNVESVTMLVTEEMVDFDLGIIDDYGQLIGEYSKLDDELWL